MVDRGWRRVRLVIMLMAWATTPAWSDDNFWPNRGVPAPAGGAAQGWAPQDPRWQSPQATPGMMQRAMQPTVQPTAQPMPQPATQPPLQQPMQPAVQPMPPADPRWSEYGHPPPGGWPPGNSPMQQPAFVNPYPGQDPRGVANPSLLGGAVSGRLLNKGCPLVNCHVVIVPLQEVDGAIRMDEDRKPLSTVTDENGVFHFEGVPAGGYKLTWLPEGQNQWIRRIGMRPDVKVHNGETTRLKEIRIALQTIN